jgi:hypothetical protein
MRVISLEVDNGARRSFATSGTAEHRQIVAVGNQRWATIVDAR